MITYRFFKILVFSSSIIVFILLNGCSEDLPLERPINGSYNLLDQNGSKVIFPEDFENKIVVMGFIFTHCPDVCPLTVNNMKLVQEKLMDENIEDIEFAALSFDPGRDTPDVLKKYADIRNINLKNFTFLTGEKPEINSLLNAMDIRAIAQDKTYKENGDSVYYFMHTDRITLIDQDGFIRKQYRGSKAEPANIINDIKFLN